MLALCCLYTIHEKAFMQSKSKSKNQCTVTQGHSFYCMGVLHDPFEQTADRSCAKKIKRGEKSWKGAGKDKLKCLLCLSEYYTQIK